MSFNEVIKKKHKSFTILEVLTMIAILAMITTTSYIKVGNILDKPKDLEITRDLKQYEDAATSLTAQGSDFTVDNINNTISNQLQLVSTEDGKVNSYDKNPYGESYRVDIIDKDNFTVTSPKIKNGESVSSVVLKISRVNGKVTSSYTNGGAVPVTPEAPKYKEGALVMEIVTTTANTVFEFPAYGPYTLNIDWGDGSVKQTVTTALTTLVKVPHTYTNPGTYIVTISGTSERVVYDGVASRVYITKILQFGNIIKSNAASMFAGCTNLTTVEGTLEGTSIALISDMFRGCSKLNSIPAFMFKGLSINESYRLFDGCFSLTEIPNDLFNGCKKFATGGTLVGPFRNTGLLEVSQYVFRGFEGTSVYGVFEGARNLRTIPNNLFEGTNIVNADVLFYDCRGLTSIPQKLFEGSNIKYISGIFQDCISIEELPAFLFKNLAIEESFRTFLGCTSLKEIPDDLFNGCLKFKTGGTMVGPFRSTGIKEISQYALRGFKGVSSYGFFEGMDKLEIIPNNLFADTDITDASVMFYGCRALKTIPSKLFEGSKVNSISSIFQECISLTEIPAFLFEGMTIENSFRTFMGCTSLKTIPDDLFNGCLKFKTGGTIVGPFRNTGITEISQYALRGFTGTSVYGMFEGMDKLVIIPGKLFEGTEITDVSVTFYDCKGLINIPADLFEGSKINSLSSTFQNCTSLTSIPPFLFKNLSINNAFRVFMGCLSLTEVPDDFLNGCLKFETGGTIVGPFRDTGITKISRYALRGFRGSSTPGLFEGMSKLTTIPVDLFFEAELKNITYMFYQCTKLTQVPELWLNSQFTSYSSCFYGCTAASNYADIKDGWK